MVNESNMGHYHYMVLPTGSFTKLVLLLRSVQGLTPGVVVTKGRHRLKQFNGG